MNETLKRTVSGLILLVLTLIGLFYQGFSWLSALVLTLCFALLGLREFYDLSDSPSKGRPFRKVGYFFSICIVLACYAEFLKAKAQSGHRLSQLHDSFINIFAPDFSIVTLSLLLLLFSAATLQLLYRPLQGAIYSVSVTLFGPIYTVLTISCAFYLLTFPTGHFYLILFLLLPISADVGAYFTGRYFGKHRVGFRLSPRKTYEGYLGAFVFTYLGGIAFLGLWTLKLSPQEIGLGYGEIFLLSLGISFTTILGDLLESAFKRDMERKDSGSIIPGHGGVLDLLDAIYWSLPLGCFYVSLRQLWASPLA